VIACSLQPIKKQGSNPVVIEKIHFSV